MIPNRSMQKAKTKGERQGEQAMESQEKQTPQKKRKPDDRGKQEEVSQPEKEKRKNN